MGYYIMVFLSLFIAAAGWWGIASDGALATPFTAIVLIVLIWKCYKDYQFKAEIKDYLQKEKMSYNNEKEDEKIDK
ncbi:MAG: hypothetical protein IJK26_03860 [Clostridia bacterium]|nr:hypothetical protein [Clostridia bacterium]